MRRLLLFIFTLLFTLEVSSQNKLSFDKLSISDGLSANKANAIAQDKNGYIWIATWNGLTRYDGYQYRIFAPTLRDSTTLSNREAVALLIGNDNNLWIGTTSGLNYLDIETEEIKIFPFSHRIISLSQDKDSNIWVGTWKDGLHILNPKTGEKKQFFYNETISDICKGDQDTYWIASYNGLIELNTKDGTHKRHYPDANKNSISNTTITQIKKDSDGSLWIGTWGGGLNKLTVDKTTRQLHFENYRHNPAKSNSICSNVVYRIYIDEFENIWCGSWDSGLSCFTKSEQNKPILTAEFQNHKKDINNPQCLSGDNISAIHVDRSGTLWVGAQMVDKSSILKQYSTFYKLTRKTKKKGSTNVTRSLMADGKDLYVGTLDEIKIYEAIDDHYKLKKDLPKPTYKYQNHIYESYSILAITQNKYGIWVGTDDAGLLLYDKEIARTNATEAKSFFNSATPHCRLTGNKVSNIEVSKIYEDVLWIGTVQNGMTKVTYSPSGAMSLPITTGNDEYHLSNNNIRTIKEDRNGIVWIGTQNGLNRYDPVTERIDKFFYSKSNEQSINNNIINCIFEDSAGDLWIGTNTGLNKKITIQTKNKSETVGFKSYTYIDQLRSNIISNITQDKYGDLWIKPYKGIIRFDPIKERIIREYQFNNFLNINIEKNAVSQASNGLICYGRNDGFMTLHPDNMISKSRPPHIFITNIEVDNKTTESMAVTDTIHTHKVILSPNEKTVKFTFSAMDFKNTKNNKYAYFLEGETEAWTDTDNFNHISFNNLKQGKYTLHIKAKNSDNRWSDNTIMVDLRIKPQWHQTIIVRFLLLFIIFALLYIFKKFTVIKADEKIRITLELLKNEKEQKINDMKTLFFTNITHEFRTPLTLIQGPVQEILEQGEISPYIEKQASLILRNTNRLLRLVNQLMDFRKADRNKMDILYQSCNITDILKDVYDGYKGVANSRNIDFSMTLEKDDVIAYLDTDKIEKILFNLTSNAFKYTDDGGKLEIIFTTDEDNIEKKTLIVDIIDDGIGIAPENQERVFERFVQTHQKKTHSTGGIGLYLSKTFVEQHEGHIELESELGKGSSFRVILPYLDIPAEDQEGVVVNKKQILVDDNSVSHLEQNTQVTFGTKEVSKKPKILVIEDDYDLNHFIKSSLSKSFNVKSCYNGNDGYAFAKEYEPNIIVSDVMMPELDGFSMCKLLKDDVNTSHIPIIFLTAKTMIADQLEGLQLGAVDYINKPFDIRALKMKIQNIFETQTDFHKNFKSRDILEPTVPELSSLDDKLLKAAVDAVNKNLDDCEFDVNRFGEEIGLSSNQAYRKIKALTGQTAKEFIRNQRLKASAAMLLQKKRSISEVIYMVGFTSPSYFTRCFKDYYNCTPKEYIEKNGIIDKD